MIKKTEKIEIISGRERDEVIKKYNEWKEKNPNVKITEESEIIFNGYFWQRNIYYLKNQLE